MGIKKSTRIENYRMIHSWADPEIGFSAETAKENGEWVTAVDDRGGRIFHLYQNAVDWIMDEWRLAKSPAQSWEEIATTMAGDMGLDWEDLPDDTQQDFIDSARQMARLI